MTAVRINNHDLVACFPILEADATVAGYVVVVIDERHAIVGTVRTLSDDEWHNGHHFMDDDPQRRLTLALARAAQRATEQTDNRDGPVRYTASIRPCRIP